MGENDIRMMADAIWTYIRDKHLKEYLSDSVCYYRAEVVSEPSNGTMQVQRPFDQPVTLPYVGSAGGLTVGDQCVVLVLGDTSNAIVLGDGNLSNI